MGRTRVVISLRRSMQNCCVLAQTGFHCQRNTRGEAMDGAAVAGPPARCHRQLYFVNGLWWVAVRTWFTQPSGLVFVHAFQYIESQKRCSSELLFASWAVGTQYGAFASVFCGLSTVSQSLLRLTAEPRLTDR